MALVILAAPAVYLVPEPLGLAVAGVALTVLAVAGYNYRAEGSGRKQQLPV